MTVDIASLVSDNLDIWTTAVEHKSGVGRGGGKRVNLYGIDRLRALILDLALRGKLVEQDERDEPAANTIAEVQKLMQAKGLLGRKPLKAIESIELPFPIPQSWEWVRLGGFVKLWNGYAFKSSDFGPSGVPVIRIGDLQNGEVDISGAMCVSDKIAELTKAQFWIPENALLIAMSGATTGKTAFNKTGTRLLLNQRVGMIESFLGNPQYLRFFLETIVAHNLAISAGSAIPNLSAEQINSTCFPLPPLAEQRRIVAKVDELMALCDALEVESTAAMAAHQALVEALLAILTTSTDAADLATNWERLKDHFDTLFTTEASVDALKQTILELAVRGRLVESLELIRQGTLDDVGEWVGGNGFPTQFQGNQAGEIPFLKVSDMNLPGNEINITTSNNWVSSETLKVMRARTHPAGTIIFPKIGGAIATNKRRILSMPAAIGNNCAGQMPNAGINVDWLFLVLSSIDMAQYQAGTSVPALNMRRLGKHPVAIPGQEDQKAIVSKVAEVMAICEALSSQIAAVAETQRRFADTVVEQAAA